MDVISEVCEDWWEALISWLRSLRGSMDILKRLQDFTNSVIHLLLVNKVEELKEVFYEGYHFLVSLFQKFLEDFS